MPEPPRLLKLRPLLGAAAAADNVQSLATAVPPSLLVTVLTSFNVGVSSVFVIVQVTAPPSGTVILFGPTNVPPSQLHTPVVL